MKLGKILIVLSLALFFQVNYLPTTLAEDKEVQVKPKDKRIIVRKDLVGASVQVEGHSEVVKLDFVREHNSGFEPITDEVLRYDELFYIEVRFNSEPQEDQHTVILEFEDSPSESIAVTKTDDPEVFRSKPIYFELPTDLTDTTLVEP